MATYTTYQQVGQAEDVSDLISNITPSDTPFYSSIKSEKVAARIYEWQTDSLAAGADNANVEGADASDISLTPTTMLSNTVQIFQKTFKISRTSDVVKTYGRAKETAYQLGKKLKEIKSTLSTPWLALRLRRWLLVTTPRRLVSSQTSGNRSIAR